MIKPNDPRKLAIDLLPRSICSVQVGAALADNHGIFSWGWNSVGSGFGEHAEAAAFRRTSKERIEGATLYVASQRRRTGKAVTSKPCTACQHLIEKWHVDRIWWRSGGGIWVREDLI